MESTNESASKVVPFEPSCSATQDNHTTVEIGMVSSGGGGIGKISDIAEPDFFESVAEKLLRDLKGYVLTQNINTMPDVEKLQEKTSMYKGSLPIRKLFFLGVLAGIWCGAAVTLVLTIAGGIPVDVRSAWPCLPKLAAGLFFPVAIFLIIIFGGELFTGNAMVMCIGFLAKRVTPMQIIYNWSVVLVSNFVGCVYYMYFFASLTQLFDHEPWQSYAKSVAVTKINLPPHVAFLRAIPANALVCTSVLLGQLSRDLTGRLAGMWFPIMIFAVCGYEHAIANMAFIPGGLLCGADAVVDYRQWLYQNLLLAILGNLVGGGFMIGGTVFYLFNWTKQPQQAGKDAGPLAGPSKPPPPPDALLTAVEKDRACAAFLNFDGDRDGRVSPAEALCALESVGIRHTQQLVEALMRSQAEAGAGQGPLLVDMAGFIRLATRLRDLERLGLAEGC